MWRLLQRILLFSLVLYCNGDETIGACPDDSVCAIFMDTKKEIETGFGRWNQKAWCLINGVKHTDHVGGFLWEESSTCNVNEFNYFHHAFLTITPDTIHNWEFNLIVWTQDGPDEKEQQKITNIGFDFGKAQFKFKNDEWLEFDWKDKAGKDMNAKINMTKVRQFGSGGCRGGKQLIGIVFESKWPCIFQEYKFTVELLDENLFDYFGVEEFRFTRFQDGYGDLTLKDRRFREKLSTLLSTECDPEDVNQPCYQTCDKLGLTKTEIANCTLDLWYHDNLYSKYTRQWRNIDEIKCKGGRWRAIWGGEKPGHQVLNFDRFEVQCADGMPSRMTALMSGIMIGGGVGGGLILIIILVIVGFLLYKKVKRNDNKDTNRATTRSESNVEGKSSKNTSNRIPGVSPTASSTPSKTTSPFTPRH